MALGNMDTTSVETFRPTHNDQRRPLKAVRLHAVTVLLLIVGLILWTPTLPWLFKSVGSTMKKKARPTPGRAFCLAGSGCPKALRHALFLV